MKFELTLDEIYEMALCISHNQLNHEETCDYVNKFVNEAMGSDDVEDEDNFDKNVWPWPNGFDLSGICIAPPDEWADENIVNMPLFELGKQITNSDVDGSGVYFMYWENKVVYVGQSTNLKKRINGHSLRINKDYQNVTVLFDIPTESLKSIEAFYIHLFKPKFNKNYPQMTKAIKAYYEEVSNETVT